VPCIPDHELIRCIGKGSYGEVWLARSIVGTYRAVKVVRRKSFSDERPFEREFAGLKRFEPISRTHPGFISILHIGRNERSKFFYCIMEIADDLRSGQAIAPGKYAPRTLASELTRRVRLPLGECVEIGSSLAAALKHLHRNGLVHRDIKPSNIIFVDGLPKLADIGLVTAISEATTSLGTRGYAPPEESGHPTADLYSLGKVLYEISTGKGPERFPELPADLNELCAATQFIRFNEIILKACEANVQKRFQSAEAMRVVLSQCQDRAHTASTRDTDSRKSSRTNAVCGGERKLLTVVFVQIARTERADPEAAQSFMRGCLDIITPALQRFGGTPVQTLSDGVMAVFGGPVACEDHARRAAHSALAVQQTLGAYREDAGSNYGFGFEVRISLSTGLAISETGGPEQPPTGDVVDLAGQILNSAQPGEIVMTDATCKVVRDYFLVKELGDRRVHGKGTPLKVFELTAARHLRTRIEAGLERGLTPFVGRAKEFALLRERLADARTGHGQIVLLAGEPGLGKSRLLLEFQHSLAVGEICWLAGRSISFGSQIAYLPIIDLMRRLFGMEDGENQTQTYSRFEAEAEALGADVLPDLPFIKQLLSLDTKCENLPDMDAQQRRVKTFEALRNVILKRAQRDSVILVLEDLHWVDRTSQDFLVSLADSLSMAPILMVLTYRPGYQNPFPERSFVTRLTLQQLSDKETLEMAGQMLTDHQVPEQLRDLVLGKAEGNPFFVEEMIKSLQEAGALEPRDGSSKAGKASARIEVPDAIQDVVMSRIDRLEPSPRKALQLASVIGREFTIELLETISDLNEPLAESLQKLKSAELIYERSVFPQYTCFFKHALTQEVAYNSLLLQRRKELHCLVAAAIEELHASRLPEFYGLLAYHYERGEEWERALDYLRRAAERCHTIAAFREEAYQLGQAMAIAQRLAQPEVVSDLRGQRGVAWVKCGLWAKARPDLETALMELPPENLSRRAELLSSLAGACFWDLDVPSMQKYAIEGGVLAQSSEGRGLNDDLIAGLLSWLGAKYQMEGDLTAATELYDRALAKGAGYCSAALAMYPMALYFQGRLAEGLERARESAEAFRSFGDVFAATFGHPHLGLALASCGRYSEAARVFDEARQLGRKHEIWTFQARTLAMSAGFHLDLFDFKGNEKLAEEAREQARSAGFRPSEVSAGLDLVFNFARRGEFARAEVLARETAITAAQVGGWHQWLWQLRLQQANAEIACAAGDWRRALDYAEATIAQSLHRRAKYLVLGVETRARALAGLGRKIEAIKDLRQAVQSARKMGDPAVFLRTATTLLATEGEDSVLQETRATARRIRDQLDAEMRRHFESAQQVLLLGPLDGNVVGPMNDCAVQKPKSKKGRSPKCEEQNAGKSGSTV
jgi:class 3 adenylate cyclase/tetratricopeptide (TPR) repeat protein